MSSASDNRGRSDVAQLGTLVVPRLPDVLFRVSPDGTILEWQEFADVQDARIHQDRVGQPLHVALPEEVAQQLLHAAATARATGRDQVAEYELPFGIDRKAVRAVEARIAATTTGDVVCLVRDVSGHAALEARLKESVRLLAALAETQEEFISGAGLLALHERFLRQAMILSESAFGLIGSVDTAPSGKECLRVTVVRDLEKNCEKRFVRDPTGEGAFVFGQDDGLVGATLCASSPIVVNHLVTAIEATGLPRKCGPLTTFLGIPILRGSERMAALILGNRKVAFDDEFVAYLSPLVSAYASMLSAQRTEERRQAFEHALTDSEARLRAIVDGAIDAIVTIDERGIIESANTVVEVMFGYAPHELVGQNVSCLMPPPHREQHDGYIANYLQTGIRRMLGTRRELTAQRKDGVIFPAEIYVNEVWLAGRRFFVGMIRDVSERKAVDRMTSEFVATVSHELRTPLTSIRGSLMLLSSNLIGPMPSQAQDVVQIALRNSERLLRLVSDLLDIEKVSSDRMDFHFARLSLVQVVRRAVEAHAEYAHAHDAHFLLVEEAEGDVLGDDDRLMQVLANLLSNAAKFSPKGSSIEVSVQQHGGFMRVAVRDFGPGIPAAFRSRMFKVFAQADSSSSRGKSGAGLGLSIAKSIIDRHGGQIGFEAAAGGGTRFYFDLSRLPPDFKVPKSVPPGASP